MPGSLIRASLHLQKLKFGTAPMDLNTIIKDQNILRSAQAQEISEIGIRLSYAENRALFAVQSLLDAQEYKGPLKVQVSDYLDAYRVGKSRTKRKKSEYHSASSQAALESLLRLGEINHLIAFDRTERSGKKFEKSRREYIAPLVKVTKDKGDLEIVVFPILTDQIDSYYCWLPKDLFSQSRADPAKILFLEYLNYHYDNERKKRGHPSFTLKYQRETWAYKLRMDSYIKNRQWGRLERKLKELFEFGKSQGLISEYAMRQPGTTVDHLDVISLNVELFKVARSAQDGSKVSLSETQSLPMAVAEG